MVLFGRGIVVTVRSTFKKITQFQSRLSVPTVSAATVGFIAIGALFFGGTPKSDAEQAAETPVQIASLEAPEQGSLDPDLDPTNTETAVDKALSRVTITIKSGDTLMRALTRAGANRVDAHNAIQAISDHFDPRKLKPGHLLTITFDDSQSESLSTNLQSDATQQLAMIQFRPNPMEELIAVRNDIGEYVSSIAPVALSLQTERAVGVIQSSLSGAAQEAGLPHAVTQKFINIYSYGVDFQREIQPGDSFEVLYEVRLDDTGKVVDYGNILFAELTLSDNTRQLYRFEHTDLARGFGYYDPEGKSAIRALMRTPINGARLSSGYGRRMHPILGYVKQHRGLDFAAPTGTPILAAGDGVIDRIGTNGAYGKYIRIRHNDTFSTAYAHMSRYGKGMTRNKRVAQGQVIGYVGSTGRSTGPHLHYEILKNGVQVNPRTVELPTTDNLDGSLLTALQDTISQTEHLIAATPLPKTIANR